MKKTKALIAMLLTFIMILSVASPVLADEEVVADITESVTVSNEETEAEAQTDDVTFLDLLFGQNTADENDEAEVPAEEPADEPEEEPVVDAEVSSEDAAEEPTEEPVEEPAGEPEDDEPQGEYVWSKIPFINSIYKNGVPAITTQSFTQVFRTIQTIQNLLQGRYFWGDDDTFDVTVSEDIQEICKEMSDNCCLDVNMILTNLPDITEASQILNKVFKIDLGELRTELYTKRDELWKSGDNTKANLYFLLGAYLGGLESAYVYLEPYKDVYQVAVDVTYSDGTVEKMVPGIYINPETGDFYGKGEKGVLSTGFNSNYKQLLVYAPMYCWMRNFGFCIEYDILCYILPMYCYNTRRFKFNYGGKEWMIQMWKGNYLITNGGEVGIYNRAPGSVGSYYDVVTDEERLPMSLKIYHGYDLLVDIPEQVHWWVNGFQIANNLYSPHSLNLVATITFEDEEMLKAFCESVDKNIYHDVKYSVDGLTVTIIWDT